MTIKNIVEEDFVNYKVPSMFIATCYCDWKCCTERGLGIDICQNSPISVQPNISIEDKEIFKRYISNTITRAVVVGGLEPLMQQKELINLIKEFRDNGCNDMFVIYTGYEIDETPMKEIIPTLKQLVNVIVKVGRYIPNDTPHFDAVLGVNLASNNQRGVIIN